MPGRKSCAVFFDAGGTLMDSSPHACSREFRRIRADLAFARRRGNCPGCECILRLYGIVLITGRLLHAKALYDGNIPLRVAGMLATFAVIVVASAYIIAKAVI
jgi:hypothetical protein